MSLLKKIQPQYIGKSKPVTIYPPRVLHCASCDRNTNHAYNREAFASRVYVCLTCGAEKSA
jgi:hypothetical protein